MVNEEQTDIPLKRVELVSYLILSVFGLAGWLILSSLAGISVLVGGLMAILSFQLMRRGAARLALDPDRQGKFWFILKSLGRLVGLGTILYFLIRYQHLHIPGFLVGLTTVQLGIILTAVSKLKRLLA